jgi:hypothetical protein
MVTRLHHPLLQTDTASAKLIASNRTTLTHPGIGVSGRYGYTGWRQWCVYWNWRRRSIARVPVIAGQANCGIDPGLRMG